MVQLSKRFLLAYDGGTSGMYFGHSIFCVYLSIFLVAIRYETTFDYALTSALYWVLMMFINAAQFHFHHIRKMDLLNYGNYALWELQFSVMTQYCYWYFIWRLVLLLFELMGFILILVISCIYFNLNTTTILGIYQIQSWLFIILHGFRLFYRIPVFVVLNCIISDQRAAPFFPFLPVDTPTSLLAPPSPPVPRPSLHDIMFQSDIHSASVCGICLEIYNETKPMSFLNCNHLYHTECIDKWFTGGGRICPNCGR